MVKILRFYKDVEINMFNIGENSVFSIYFNSLVYVAIKIKLIVKKKK